MSHYYFYYPFCCFPIPKRRYLWLLICTRDDAREALFNLRKITSYHCIWANLIGNRSFCILTHSETRYLEIRWFFLNSATISEYTFSMHEKIHEVEVSLRLSYDNSRSVENLPELVFFYICTSPRMEWKNESDFLWKGSKMYHEISQAYFIIYVYWSMYREKSIVFSCKSHILMGCSFLEDRTLVCNSIDHDISYKMYSFSNSLSF